MNGTEDAAYAVVTTACGSMGEAERIAAALVDGGLAACVQMLPVKSRYVWKGEACRDDEVLLLVKCRRERYKDIERTILEHHSYELPEILMTPVAGGYAKYLAWIKGA